MKVTIRPALSDDRPAIEAASRETWDAHRARQPFAFAENGWDFGMARWHEIAFRGPTAEPLGESGNLFLADAGGQMVGFVLLSWHLRADVEDMPDGAILDIWVHPDWRHKGVGQNLVGFAKDMATEADWDSLTADVWTGAPSSGLFEAAGFAPQSTTWRFGPDRPARARVKREEAKAESEDRWWKWAVLLVIVACFAAIMMTQQ
ncbi:GNAT family N-acetyltransferase [Gymnodinialimonas hymeniacidonis]|uniref:GNAT family N-acetyltransferase n=1 Tax=Gymnodinialimonas hymeniacidonis TaxID=3126508 RepID=UPI0034C68A1B